MDIRTDLQHKHNAARARQEYLLSGLAPNESLSEDALRTFNQLGDEKRALKDRLDALNTDERSTSAAATTLGEFGASYSPADKELADQFRNAIINRSPAPIDIRQPHNLTRSGYQPGIERRTQTTSGNVGVSFYNSIQDHLVESSAILAAGATVIQSANGEPLKIPKSTGFSTASIVAEGALIGTSDPTLGSVQLGAYKYGFLVQVSTELAVDAQFDLLGFLSYQAGLAIGNGFGAHAINGTGTNQPRGILTDATLGVAGPTGTATSFGNQTTAGQGGDLLLDLVASLAEPYARSQSAAWLMRSSTLNAIRKLRDSTGRYIFSSDIISGSSSAGTLLGRPVYLDPNVPAIGASAKSILFGDLSRYFVRQVNGLRFERSDDYAFGNDVTTFRALARLDGVLTDTTGAVKYFQHSAS